MIYLIFSLTNSFPPISPCYQDFTELWSLKSILLLVNLMYIVFLFSGAHLLNIYYKIFVFCLTGEMWMLGAPGFSDRCLFTKSMSFLEPLESNISPTCIIFLFTLVKVSSSFDLQTSFIANRKLRVDSLCLHKYKIFKIFLILIFI